MEPRSDNGEHSPDGAEASSHALVPRRAALEELGGDPEIERLYRALQPRARVFLATLREVGTLTGAADLSGCSRQAHYHWMKTCPGYSACYEAIDQELRDALERLLYERVLNGMEEER